MKHLTPAGATCAALLLATLAACSTPQKCTPTTCTDDQRLNQAVKAALYSDTAMRAPNLVYASTRDGVVYLTGTVATDLQKQSAESHARSVSGVLDVVNSISVDNSAR
jgi:osmotically-inducible protein OsmY